MLHFNPDMDVMELIEYVRIKNVGLILWVLWHPVVKYV